MLEILWEPGSQVPSEFTAQSLTEDELSQHLTLGLLTMAIWGLQFLL